MRRHYSNYFKGIPYVKPFRNRLVTSDSYDDVLEIVAELRTHALTSVPSLISNNLNADALPKNA